MKEKLYTLPVNEAYHKDCECPVCAMYDSLEKDAISYTIGPSYMEDDIREETNTHGFCGRHVKMLYEAQNRLGLALMLSTHMEKTIKDITRLTQNTTKGTGLFKRKEESPVYSYIKKVESSCFVCNHINQTFDRYLATILYLYRTEEDFRNLFKSSKGLCQTHYGRLYQMAGKELSGAIYEEFIHNLNQVYLSNMERTLKDLTWFIDKFDYRNANEPWKNAKDALPRSILKLNSKIVD